MELTTTLVYQTYEESQAPRAVRLREEQLDITKSVSKSENYKLHKEVVEEQRTVHVPLFEKKYM